MTPQEIFDYKLKWSNNAHEVQVHSDLFYECYAWCKKNAEQWEWSYQKYTDVYAHTFYFESKEKSLEFYKDFNKWAKLYF
jgi:hypothetical protein